MAVGDQPVLERLVVDDAGIERGAKFEVAGPVEGDTTDLERGEVGSAIEMSRRSTTAVSRPSESVTTQRRTRSPGPGSSRTRWAATVTPSSPTQPPSPARKVTASQLGALTRLSSSIPGSPIGPPGSRSRLNTPARYVPGYEVPSSRAHGRAPRVPR